MQVRLLPPPQCCRCHTLRRRENLTILRMLTVSARAQPAYSGGPGELVLVSRIFGQSGFLGSASTTKEPSNGERRCGNAASARSTSASRGGHRLDALATGQSRRESLRVILPHFSPTG